MFVLIGPNQLMRYLESAQKACDQAGLLLLATGEKPHGHSFPPPHPGIQLSAIEQTVFLTYTNVK
jgi:hypothetical protein